MTRSRKRSNDSDTTNTDRDIKAYREERNRDILGAIGRGIARLFDILLHLLAI